MSAELSSGVAASYSAAKEVIAWNEDGETGRVRLPKYEGPCYRPEYAIRMELLSYVDVLLHNPRELLAALDAASAPSCEERAIQLPELSRRESPLTQARPRFTGTQLADLRARIPHVAFALLRALVRNLITRSAAEREEGSDGMFLAQLGSVRDWKQGCAVCLVDKMMGTTCACGHTEIVVFRPCGHSICVEPCFRQWAASQKVELQPQTMRCGNQVFLVVGKVCADLPRERCASLRCPCCGTDLQSCFRAENVHVAPLLAGEAREASSTLFRAL